MRLVGVLTELRKQQIEHRICKVIAISIWGHCCFANVFLTGLLTKRYYEYASFLVTAFLSGTETERQRAVLVSRAIDFELLGHRIRECSFGGTVRVKHVVYVLPLY
jgi:hypothetical protein